LGRIIAIGEGFRVRGFGLAGCDVLPADHPEAVREAWTTRGSDVDLVILTSSAADALREDLAAADAPLVAVMPQ
jgi:vacuolar-type H+-ATPase subunit F/Vma7